MADTPPDDGAARSDDTAKLELPSLERVERRRPRREPEPTAVPVEDTEETRPFVLAPEPAATNGAHAEEPVDGSEAEPASEPGQRKATRPRQGLPTLPAPLAALLGGLVVGAFGAGLTWVSLTGCDAIRGTESCGGAGVLVIFAILVLMVLLGGLVLAMLHLNDAKATSFLAVGVLFVVVLLTPQDALFSAWMFLVVPLVSAAAFVLAHWVTATFVEPQPEKGPAHDVR